MRKNEQILLRYIGWERAEEGSELQIVLGHAIVWSEGRRSICRVDFEGLYISIPTDTNGRPHYDVYCYIQAESSDSAFSAGLRWRELLALG